MYQISFLVFLMSVYYTNCASMESKDMMTYLNRYGYLSSDDMKSENTTSIESAVREFQTFANINVTGKMDDETTMMMLMPRCGMKDKINFENNMRSKRYTLHERKWDYRALTYHILNFTHTLHEPDVRYEIGRASSVWSDHSDVSFEETEVNADITIRFIFDESLNGPGAILAYAYYPKPTGKTSVHFDLSEEWTVGADRGINLFQVAAHEFGHSLGLRHSRVKNALMTPFYGGYIKNFKLPSDDIMGIQKLYGKKSTTLKVEDAELCNTNAIDTIFTSPRGEIFIFKGMNYWRINLSSSITQSRRISTDWPGLPRNIDAAVIYETKTYFFKGDQYWRYIGLKLDGKFPKRISEGFPGIPNNIDAVLARNEGGKIYFFKGSTYWRLDAMEIGRISEPKPISNWGGVPIDLNAAFEYNFETYFVKDEVYYKFNDHIRTVETSTLLRYFFGCKGVFGGAANIRANNTGIKLTNSSGHNNTISIKYYVLLCIYLSTIFNKF